MIDVGQYELEQWWRIGQYYAYCARGIVAGLSDLHQEVKLADEVPVFDQDTSWHLEVTVRPATGGTSRSLLSLFGDIKEDVFKLAANLSEANPTTRVRVGHSNSWKVFAHGEVIEEWPQFPYAETFPHKLV